MCSSGAREAVTMEDKRLARFVELLIHDYLNSRGFSETEAKFAEERTRVAASASDAVSVRRKGVIGSGSAAVGNRSGGSGGGDSVDGLDDASSWYCLAGKLALPVRYTQLIATKQTHVESAVP